MPLHFAKYNLSKIVNCKLITLHSIILHFPKVGNNIIHKNNL